MQETSIASAKLRDLQFSNTSNYVDKDMFFQFLSLFHIH